MKVCVVTTGFPRPSEVFATLEVRALREADADVSVHGLYRERPGARRLAEERGVAGVAVTHATIATAWRGLLEGVRHPGRLAGVLRFLRAAGDRSRGDLRRALPWVPRSLEILAEIEERDPDVVHLFWGHYPSIVGRLVQRHLPAVATSTCLRAFDLRRRFGPTAAVARDADAVFTIAEANLPAIEALGVPREAVTVVRDGIDLTALPTPAGKEPRSILTVGRLVPSKAVGDALDVLARVRGRFADARLRVIGDGRERPRLERRAAELGVADAVSFEGHRPHGEVLQAMARADVLLHPSRLEVLPNVVKEGMACGCACVVARTDGLAELLEHGRHGFVFEPGDLEAAAAAVERAFEGGGDVDALRAAAATRVRERFEERATAAAYLERWRRTVEARHRSR